MKTPLRTLSVVASLTSEAQCLRRVPAVRNGAPRLVGIVAALSLVMLTGCPNNQGGNTAEVLAVNGSPDVTIHFVGYLDNSFLPVPGSANLAGSSGIAAGHARRATLSLQNPPGSLIGFVFSASGAPSTAVAISASEVGPGDALGMTLDAGHTGALVVGHLDN